MRNFDRCSISSSFFDSDHVSINGSEFAFPASLPSLNALLENREMLGISHGNTPARVGLIKIYREVLWGRIFILDFA